MKKSTMITACMIVLFASQMALAQDLDGKVGIGANVSYMSIADTGDVTSIKFDGAALIGVNLTYCANKSTSYELIVGYSQLKVDAKGATSSFDLGELRQIPVLLTGRLHLPLKNGAVSPYFGGGVGYYYNEFDPSQIVTLVGGKVDTDDSVAFHLTTGVDFFVGDHVTMGIDLKYLWNEAGGDLTFVGVPAATDLDLNTFTIGISLKFYR